MRVCEFCRVHSTAARSNHLIIHPPNHPSSPSHPPTLPSIAHHLSSPTPRLIINNNKASSTASSRPQSPVYRRLTVCLIFVVESSSLVETTKIAPLSHSSRQIARLIDSWQPSIRRGRHESSKRERELGTRKVLWEDEIRAEEDSPSLSRLLAVRCLSPCSHRLVVVAVAAGEAEC